MNRVTVQWTRELGEWLVDTVEVEDINRVSDTPKVYQTPIWEVEEWFGILGRCNWTITFHDEKIYTMYLLRFA